MFSYTCYAAKPVATGDTETETTSKCQNDDDCDGLSNSEEGDKDGDGEIDEPNECDPKLADTDGDGLTDLEEKNLGTYCNACDSDSDALSDGVEQRRVQPIEKNGCHGLYTAGSNFKKPFLMDPLNPDSDGDGLLDGEEDKNNNGWVDSDDTDPTLEDTDNDDLSDYLETIGDFNGDSVPDFNYRLIRSGQGCSPPVSIADVDCDDLPNAIDDDSDNDGCPDRDEGRWLDSNNNGIPDVYDSQAKLCKETGMYGGGGGSTASPSESAGEGSSATSALKPLRFVDGADGAACSLVAHKLSGATTVGSVLMLVLASCILGIRQLSLRKKD